MEPNTMNFYEIFYQFKQISSNNVMRASSCLCKN